ncbi:MAG TPA: hypothetical protein VNU71_13495 [Burkholderiaceae bacterium]|nr:hypothetical protein [Burkholderiaceae bacterium]
MDGRAAPLNRGMVIDVGVGESLELRSPDGRRIVVSVEPKSGQRSRLRVQSDEHLNIERAKTAKPG